MRPKLLDAGRCVKCGDSEPKLAFFYSIPEYIKATCVRCGYVWNVPPLDAGAKESRLCTSRCFRAEGDTRPLKCELLAGHRGEHHAISAHFVWTDDVAVVEGSGI
jgi:hypothetical protein